jgi:nucleotide-binding universal stress UspA family protein
MKQPENAIVVAVGHHGCQAAVEYAVEEARRRGSPVHLVKILRLPATPEYAGVYAAGVSDSTAEIESAIASAHKLAAPAGVAVTGEVVEDGWVVDELVRSANRSRMIVLQHRRVGALHRIVTGSTTNGVAARATVPVVSVPDDWSASDHESDVTVAVQDATEAAGLLRAGFEGARERGANLVVLHAWWLASGFDETVVDQTMRQEWEDRIHTSLRPALAGLKEEFADVHVDVLVRHAPPVEAILDAAQRSGLLVLGRRHHRLPLGTHLGPIARATLQHSSCPVLLVPPDPQSR